MSILHAHTRVGVRVQKSILQKNTRVFFVTKKIIIKTTAGSSQSCETQAKPTCGRAESRSRGFARALPACESLCYGCLELSRVLCLQRELATPHCTTPHPESPPRPVPGQSQPPPGPEPGHLTQSVHCRSTVCLRARWMDGWMQEPSRAEELISFSRNSKIPLF